ncbi:MAG: DUF364 domain-containing protein [Deltaproteobacteria bacterium]|jgi:uncharacterized protein (DUF4213/DUF364 family)|nr:DUF364 domain-containing protein [Deltaproteobacteria bacterium]
MSARTAAAAAAAAAAKWSFYQDVIAAVNPSDRAAACVKGRHWMALKSDRGGVGLAHFLPQNSPPQSPPAEELLGRPLRELAELIKSWDFHSASVGLAAINASLTSDLLTGSLDHVLTCGNAFDHFLQKVKGRRAAVVGHFPRLERLAQAAESMIILERAPLPGDLPDSAAEYVLPEQDCVFITGTTIINKTLPRLLELSAQAEVFLVGPSVPLCPGLFDYGLQALSGSVVDDYVTLALNLSSGLALDFDKSLARQVNLLRPD